MRGDAVAKQKVARPITQSNYVVNHFYEAAKRIDAYLELDSGRRSAVQIPPDRPGLPSCWPAARGTADSNVDRQDMAATNSGRQEEQTRKQRRWLLGLIAEQVSDVSPVKPEQVISSSIQLPQTPYLGAIIKIDHEMVQLIAVDRVLEDPLLTIVVLRNCAGRRARVHSERQDANGTNVMPSQWEQDRGETHQPHRPGPDSNRL